MITKEQNMTRESGRITFNETVCCARIVGSTIQNIDPDRLKAKPIVFKPRGQILSVISAPTKISVFNMEPIVEKTPKINIINGWSIDIHMRLYYEDTQKQDVIKTTPVQSIEGDVVTTRSGSVYKLGNLDILVAKQLGQNQISNSAPLAEETLPFLINAAYDVYPGFYESFD